MKNIICLLVLGLPVFAFGSNTRDTDKCKLDTNFNTRNFCLAVAEMSIRYCDVITHFENKMLCLKIVRENQRRTVLGIKPLDDTNTEKR